MKVEITKQVKIYNCIAFLELSYLIQREDIKDFLNGKGYDDESINKKIEEYLKKVKILDEYGSPTKYGEKIKETGKVYENQVGKFKVWYTLNDSILGNTILGLKREYSRDNNAIKSDQIAISSLENRLLSINANDKQKYFLSGDIKLKNKSISNYSSCNDKLYPITFEKEWEDLDSLAKISFRGSINDGNVSYSISNKKYEDRDKLEYWLIRYEGNWDFENKLFLVDFVKINDNEKTTFVSDFEREWQVSSDGQIATAKFSNASIAPKTLSDAQDWLDWLVVKKLKGNYISIGDLQQYSNEIISRKEFAKFSNLKPNLPKKNSDKIAYWHYKACEDLCSDNYNNKL